MVLDFGRDEYKLSDVQLSELSKRVREGDLTAVLKAWEQDIKVRWSPLLSVRSLPRSPAPPSAVAHPLGRRRLPHPHAPHSSAKGQGGRGPRHGRHREDAALAAAYLRLCRSCAEYLGAVRRGKLGERVDEAGWGQEAHEGGEEEMLDDVEVRARTPLRSSAGHSPTPRRRPRQLDLLLSPPRELPSTSPALTQGLLLLSLSSLRSYASSSQFPSQDTQLRTSFLDDVRALEDEGAKAKGEARRVLLARMWRWGGALGWTV